MSRFICLALLAMLLQIGVAAGEVVYLNDGTRIEGKIKRSPDGWTITKSDGSVVSVKADDVAGIEAGKPATPGPQGADRLASLRRAVDHLSDIQQIIGRYEQFIAANPSFDPSVLADANKDLQMWHDRLDQGLVKLGEKWITPQERDHRRQLAQTAAMSARDLLVQYRYNEAQRALHEAIVQDPASATALYLQGVMLYQQDQLDQARQSFAAANDVLPSYGPILNNLAVIAWRLKSPVAAMNFYNQAMEGSPLAKDILDNVAEALNAMPEQVRQAAVVQRAAVTFRQQDTELQKRAADQGFFRWGSSWVNAKQLEDLKAAAAKVQQQIDQLSKQFDGLTAKIDDLDKEIDDDQRQMHRFEAAATVIDPNGNTIHLPLPQVYYDLKTDVDNLTAKKKDLQNQQEVLRAQAKQLQQGLPTPQYNGVQKIIGLDGVPIRDSTAGDSGGAATQPTFAPDSIPATQP
jgi:tetratricopeptide (TPR) repeat protein